MVRSRAQYALSSACSAKTALYRNVGASSSMCARSFLFGLSSSEPALIVGSHPEPARLVRAVNAWRARARTHADVARCREGTWEEPDLREGPDDKHVCVHVEDDIEFAFELEQPQLGVLVHEVGCDTSARTNEREMSRTGWRAVGRVWDVLDSARFPSDGLEQGQGRVGEAAGNMEQEHMLGNGRVSVRHVRCGRRGVDVTCSMPCCRRLQPRSSAPGT